MDFNDIRDDLDEDIDIKGDFELKDISAGDRKNKSTNDILDNKSDIDLSGQKFIKILKSNTKNFDSFLSFAKLKDINITQKTSGVKNTFNNIKLSKKILRNNYLKIFLTLIIVVFGFKLALEHSIHSGYNRIISLKDNPSSIEYVQKQINNARFDFVVANILFSPFMVLPSKNVENAYHVIKGGKLITKVADNLIQYIYGLQSFVSQKGLENIYVTNLLENSKKDFIDTELGLRSALYHYDQIDNIGDTQLEEKLGKGIGMLRESLAYIHTLNSYFDTFLNTLGHNEERKYLVVFQNNDEIRPTGGFMGSMGLVTLYRGKIKDFEMTDIYAYEWEINKVYTDKIPAPKGLNKLTGTFGLRDANYFVGFDSSAKQMKYFLDKINAKVDGLVFINQNVVKDLLTQVDGVEFDKIGETITADNFSLIISTLVEAKTFKVGSLGSPKQVLFDFSELFLKKLSEQKSYTSYLSIILKHIQSRDIVIYSFIPEENSFLWKMGLTGKMKYNSSMDFSYPVFTSLSGNKSDRYIKRKFDKKVLNNTDCSIETTYNISSSHHYTKQDEEQVDKLLTKFNIQDKDHIQYIQGRGDNHQYLRILFPIEAKIDPNPSYEIIKGSNFQILETFITTRRLETKKISISYTLENKECSDYSYIHYKQPGIHSYDINFNNSIDDLQIEGLKSDFKYKKD